MMQPASKRTVSFNYTLVILVKYNSLTIPAIILTPYNQPQPDQPYVLWLLEDVLMLHRKELYVAGTEVGQF